MRLHIQRDIFDNPVAPPLYLCNTDKSIIGELPAYDIKLDGKWNTYSELQFSIDRTYNDAMSGETKVHPLFDLTEGLRKVYVPGYGYFVIQDPDEEYADNETKTISCFSSEYEIGQRYLKNFHVNTGEDDSIEVTYYASQYGNNYYENIDNRYTKAETFDAERAYYKKTYTDKRNYTWERVQINDEDEFKSYDGSTTEKILYITKYENVRFYWESKPELSLLHLVFSKIPEWQIAHVDKEIVNDKGETQNLWAQERKFSEEYISVYDFIYKMCETFHVVVEWNTLNNTVKFYAEAEDGVAVDGTIQNRFDTDVFISRENLANEIQTQYSTDDIKTRLKVAGGDDLSIREINIGSDYIMNLDYYHTVEWMGQELYDRYAEYKTLLAEQQVVYEEAAKKRVAAYNQWNELMNAVPAENNAMLVGDEFDKLYCLYAWQPCERDYDSTDSYYLRNNKGVIKKCNPQPDATQYKKGEHYSFADWRDLRRALNNKLKTHHVNEDTEANNKDNILFTLRDDNDNQVTIRMYYNTTEKVYEIKKTLTYISSSSASDTYFSIKDWIKHHLTADKMDLTGYKITSIGTLGAYLCLAKDETNEANFQDYGVNLLKEKKKIYTEIFIVQTEGFMSNENAHCIASEEEPKDKVVGDRWLQTSSVLNEDNADDASEDDISTLQLFEWNGKSWEEVHLENYDDQENYARYIENYNKLQAVQNVLSQKEREAAYRNNGYALTTRRITKDNITEDTFKEVCRRYFAQLYKHCGIQPDSFNPNIPLYICTVTDLSDADSGEDDKKGIQYAMYLKGVTPYIAYAESVGVNQLTMDYIASTIDMDTFFKVEDGDKDRLLKRLSPFIREDEFTDTNFALTGYESEEERMNICKELKVSAEKKLKQLSQPSLEFSMDMDNILALPEFDGIKNQFALGNFIRVGIRPGYTKRARLLEVHLDFEDMSDFSADFGNLVTTKSEIDKHADLLAQAMQAGKSVASNASNWQKAVEKSNSIDKAITEGLKDAVLEVGAAYGQSITWDQYGIWGRKLIDGTTDQYEDEQFRMINNKLVFSGDAFKTAKAVFGKFKYKDKERWGVLADAVVAGYIEGSEIRGSDLYGGSLTIGGEDGDAGLFKVDSDGSVTINGSVSITDSNGKDIYNEVSILEESRRYYTELTYDSSTIFATTSSTCTITCNIYSYDENITDKVLAAGATFAWKRTSTDTTADTTWNAAHIWNTVHNGLRANQITITNIDVVKNAQFSCSVTFDTAKISTEE